MKNYKINIDKPKPTQEEILAGRNFDSVLAQYKAAPGTPVKKPFWQKAGFITSVVAVAATATIVALMMNGKDEQNANDKANPAIVQNNDNSNSVQSSGNTNQGTAVANWSPVKRTIAPPLKGADVPYQQYKVSAQKGGLISYPTGTKIKFQPNSFVDQSGNVITGNVEIHYREMHDAVDFFVAGIPMAYDSAGQTWQLHSAGMMEVAAFVNGKVVYLDKTKPMEVQMASASNSSRYNLYYFDTIAGNWVYQGKDKIAEMPYDKDQRKRDSLLALEKWKTYVSAQGPICGTKPDNKPVDAKRPMKADPKKNRFVVDFDKKEFPEMASYENVIFEVDESKEKFDQSNYDVTWENVVLSRGDEPSKYKLTLSKGWKKLKLDVYPVLDGEDYSKAMAEYNKLHAKYLSDSASYASYQQSSSAGNTATTTNPVATATNTPFVFDPQTMRNDAGYDVQRTFLCSGFGTYNCDYRGNTPQGSVLELALNGPDGKPFESTTFWHVDRQINSLMTYTNPCGQFFVNTRSQNLIWAVKDGELYYAENDQFTGLPFIGKASVTLTKVPKPLNTPYDIRTFFHIVAPSV